MSRNLSVVTAATRAPRTLDQSVRRERRSVNQTADLGEEGAQVVEDALPANQRAFCRSGRRRRLDGRDDPPCRIRGRHIGTCRRYRPRAAALSGPRPRAGLRRPVRTARRGARYADHRRDRPSATSYFVPVQTVRSKRLECQELSFANASWPRPAGDDAAGQPERLGGGGDCRPAGHLGGAIIALEAKPVLEAARRAQRIVWLDRVPSARFVAEGGAGNGEALAGLQSPGARR